MGRALNFLCALPFFCLFLFSTNQLNQMKLRVSILIGVVMTLMGCQSNYYSAKDFQTVLKIDSHVHLSSDKGFFEDQATKDNFVLLTINVDHSDSMAVKKQLEWVLNSIKKYPGRVFYSCYILL